MRREDRERIEALLGQMDCPKHFRCAESGFEDLCKAKDIGLDTYLECLETKPDRCAFSLSFGYSHLCTCPVRVYIAKHVQDKTPKED